MRPIEPMRIIYKLLFCEEEKAEPKRSFSISPALGGRKETSDLPKKVLDRARAVG